MWYDVFIIARRGISRNAVAAAYRLRRILYDVDDNNTIRTLYAARPHDVDGSDLLGKSCTYVYVSERGDYLSDLDQFHIYIYVCIIISCLTYHIRSTYVGCTQVYVVVDL